MSCFGAGAPEDAILQAREEFHQHLALTRRQQQHHLQSSDLLDDSDLWDDKDLDAELAGTAFLKRSLSSIVTVPKSKNVLLSWQTDKKKVSTCMVLGGMS